MTEVDIDRPSTWKKFREGLCEQCFGGCCTMPVEVKWSDLVRLGLAEGELEDGQLKSVISRLKKQKIISSYRQGTGLFMLTQKANRDCFFLDTKTRLCTVYEKRPEVCRQFPKIGPRPGYCPAFKK